MNKAIFKSAAIAVALGSVLTLGACSVEKTQEGELPDVDVNAQGGELPAYDVDTADVDVGTQPATVAVPDVDIDVGTEQATVPVPDVDVAMPEEGRNDGQVPPAESE